MKVQTTTIPISRFQRQTKQAFQQAVRGDFSVVTSRGDEVAIILHPKVFKNIFALQQKATRPATRQIRGLFGKAKLSSKEMQKQSLKLWT